MWELDGGKTQKDLDGWRRGAGVWETTHGFWWPAGRDLAFSKSEYQWFLNIGGLPLLWCNNSDSPPVPGLVCSNAGGLPPAIQLIKRSAWVMQFQYRMGDSYHIISALDNIPRPFRVSMQEDFLLRYYCQITTRQYSTLKATFARGPSIFQRGAQLNFSKSGTKTISRSLEKHQTIGKSIYRTWPRHCSRRR